MSEAAQEEDVRLAAAIYFFKTGFLGTAYFAGIAAIPVAVITLIVALVNGYSSPAYLLAAVLASYAICSMIWALMARATAGELLFVYADTNPLENGISFRFTKFLYVLLILSGSLFALVLFVASCVAWNFANPQIFAPAASVADIVRYTADIIIKSLCFDLLEHFNLNVANVQHSQASLLFGLFTFGFRTFCTFAVIEIIFFALWGDIHRVYEKIKEEWTPNAQPEEAPIADIEGKQ